MIFVKSAFGSNAVTEGRNNAKAFGFNAHSEGMNGVVVVTTIKTTIGDKTYKMKEKFILENE